MLLAPLLLAAVLTGNWTTHGPHGGGITALVPATADARVLYAGNAGGVFRSDDGGRNWRNVSGAGPDRLHNVTILAVAPDDPNTVYATRRLHAYEGEVWKTTDGGAHWTRLALPRPLVPRAIELDPSAPGTVYVASDCQLYFAKQPRAEFHEAAGIYRSTDGGATWTHTEGPPACVESLVIDPLVPSHLIVRTDFSGLYESTDRGETWQTRTLVPADGVVAHPADPALRFGIVNANVPQFLVSTDSGTTWTPRTPAGVTGRGYSFLSIDRSTGRLFLGTNEGVFRSGDGGHNWIRITALPQTYLSGISVDPSTRELLAATPFGLYASPFLYGTAEQRPIADAGTNVARLVRDPGDPLRLFALTDDVFTDTVWLGRVFRSRNGGLTWELVPNSSGESKSKGAVDAAGDLYATARNESRLYRLRRDGNAFEALEHEFRYISDVLADPVRPGVLYVFDLFGSYRSIDGGLTWGSFVFPGTSMMDVGVSDPNVIVGVTYDRVYGTFDNGRNWFESGITGQRPNPIAIAPSNASVVFLAMERTDPGNPSHILGRSNDGGRTWEQRTAPPPATRTRFSAIAVDPENPNIVWAATNAGVFVTPDAGATWMDANANLPSPTVIYSLNIAPNGTVHLGTDHGVWSLGVGGRRRAVR